MAREADIAFEARFHVGSRGEFAPDSMNWPAILNLRRLPHRSDSIRRFPWAARATGLRHRPVREASAPWEVRQAKFRRAGRSVLEARHLRVDFRRRQGAARVEAW